VRICDHGSVLKIWRYRQISNFSEISSSRNVVHGARRRSTRAAPENGARDALLVCLRDHLTVTAGATDRIVASSPVALLKAYVHENRNKFFALNGKPLPKGHDRESCPGYVHEMPGRTWFAFPRLLVESIVGGPAALAALRRQLDRLGVIRKTRGGREGPRYVTKVSAGSERIYMLCVDRRFFD
jgi:hypothetical protein